VKLIEMFRFCQLGGPGDVVKVERRTTPGAAETLISVCEAGGEVERHTISVGLHEYLQEYESLRLT